MCVAMSGNGVGMGMMPIFTVMTQLPLIRWDLFTVRSMCVEAVHFLMKPKACASVCEDALISQRHGLHWAFGLFFKNRIGIGNKKNHPRSQLVRRMHDLFDDVLIDVSGKV